MKTPETPVPASRPVPTVITEEEAALGAPDGRHTLFHVEDTRYDFVRVLERRHDGEVLMLAERHEKHGLPGPVAIRRLHTPSTFERRQRLKEEVQLSYRLNHPAIAQVHHFKIHERKPYVIMEYVDGPTLDGVMSLMALRHRPVSIAFALYVGAEVADALHHAHQLSDEAGRPLGLVHRDVSPRNISVSRNGAVKLTHFGTAWSRMVGREETQGALRKGDIAYASPEYLRVLRLTPVADLYSLGLVLLELATGRHLFQDAMEEAAESLRDLPVKVSVEELPSLPLTRLLALMASCTPNEVVRAVAGLPRDFQAVLQRALRRAPAERYPTAGQMRDALRACLAQVSQDSSYGRQEAAAELAQLISEASAARDEAELGDERLFPSGLESHELDAPRAGGKRRA
ncbi:serine/threonine protein kinase [Pyxidicoccus parkwayensis]|uniref:Serine/threonine protein kinase n=1 Tax=Pyxidicoccus parkwayensis TaxID=2813578 RepID=A0ABX7NXA9_9BACT|nr:serine/threonine-protein kinase [Pyxidicoccus parkwaysis]QSQ23076.1 serine/threonine protein kinase [Pyxidicoccus parkwaysis]